MKHKPKQDLESVLVQSDKGAASRTEFDQCWSQHMATIDENLRVWNDTYLWASAGDEWSAHFGGILFSILESTALSPRLPYSK
jgi:hypothetical protein